MAGHPETKQANRRRTPPKPRARTPFKGKPAAGTNRGRTPPASRKRTPQKK